MATIKYMVTTASNHVSLKKRKQIGYSVPSGHASNIKISPPNNADTNKYSAMRNKPNTIPVLRPAPEYVVTVSPIAVTVSPGATTVVSVAAVVLSCVTLRANTIDPAEFDDAMLHLMTH